MAGVAASTHNLPPAAAPPPPPPRPPLAAAAPPAMSTRSRDPGLPRSSSSDQLASDPQRGPLTRKRAASINTTEANSARLEDLSLHTPPAGGAVSPRSADSARDLICLCTPAPKVPRPRNAFILYRQHHQAQVVAQNPGLANPEISKIIGEQWKNQPEEVKESWKRLAEEEKARHQRQYPDYRYQPRRGGKNPTARPPTGSGEDPGRCPKCGGRYIATPRTPNATFGTTSTPKPPQPASMPPYIIPNPRVVETGHLRHSQQPGENPVHGDHHSRPPYSSHRDIDEDYDLMSPGADTKRRRFNHAGPYPASSSPVPFPNHPPPRHMRPPSLGGPPSVPPNGYGPGGPLPGPAMLARASPGPMPPPPRPSMGYSGRPASTGFDESLRLPPLQTQIPTSPGQTSDASGNQSAAIGGLGAAPQSLRESQARSVEAMVMSIPYMNKLKVLGKISPPLGVPGPASPAFETRGPVIAVEGAYPALLEAVSRVVEKTLLGSGECAVKAWRDGVLTERQVGNDNNAAEGEGSEESKSRTSSLSSTRSNSGQFQSYLKTIMEWHAKSEEMTKHVTTNPTDEKSDSKEKLNEKEKEKQGEGPASAGSSAKSATLPVALIAGGFSLTLSDKFASSVAIADSYAPVDHWQWMATLWRGIVGPDLVIYVRSATDEEVAKLGGVDFKSSGIMVVRVSEARGLDEKTERRLAFEVMEWVRAGTFKEAFGRD